MARINNNYWLDITLASWLVLLGVALLVIFAAMYGDYDANCSDYTCGCDWITMACLLLFLVASLWFVHLSYPETMEAEMMSIMKFMQEPDLNKVGFARRYVWGSNFCILMWIFFVASLPFFAIPIWGYELGYVSYDALVVTLLVYSIIAVFLLLFVVITFPEFMIMNNGRGSSFFYDTFLKCCFGPLYNPQTGMLSHPDEKTWSGVIQKHFQTDFLVGVWILFVASIAQMVYAVYLVIVYPTDAYLWIFFVSSFFLLVGTGIFVYTSYPGMFFSRSCWCYMSCQKEEQLEFDPVIMALMFPPTESPEAGASASEESPLLRGK